MKRNYKFIKNDLYHLSDADIEKLYSTYIEMDGKHQNFKGSKREYCSIISRMIKDWLKAVNKNGLSGGKGTSKGIIAKKIPIEKDIEKISEEIKDLRGKIDEAESFIGKTYKNKKDRITKAYNPKIKEKEAEIEKLQKEIEEKKPKDAKVILTIKQLMLDEKPFPGEFTHEGKRTYETMKEVAKGSIKTPREIQQIYDDVKIYTEENVPRWYKNYVGKTLDELKVYFDKLSQDRFNELNDLYYKPEFFIPRLSKSKSKTKTVPVPDIASIKEKLSKAECELETLKTDKEGALNENDAQKSKAVADKTDFLASIEKLKGEIKTKEIKIPGIDEEAKEYLESKKEKFDTEFRHYTAGLPSGDVVEFDDAYKYRRVLEYLSKIGDSGESFIAVQNFFMALPFPKILDVDKDGYKERKAFTTKISQYPYHRINFEWTPEMEKSFRSEYFVFWTCLAKNFDNKETIVDNVKLAGKIFSKLLIEDPVDYSLKYFTGDSKGVITSTVENASGNLYARSAVVTLRKIFVILSESAVIEGGKVVKFNNPNLIFTYYRDISAMMEYSQDKIEFGGKVPYELLLKYSLVKLVESASEETQRKLSAKIVECQSLGYYAKKSEYSKESTLDIVDSLLSEHYGTSRENHEDLVRIANDKRTLFLPVGSGYARGTPDYERTKDIFTKAKSDLDIIGYSKVLFPDGEPTIEEYSRLYRSKKSEVKNYTGSYISEFHYKSIVGGDAVITDVRDGDGEDLGGTIGESSDELLGDRKEAEPDVDISDRTEVEPDREERKVDDGAEITEEEKTKAKDILKRISKGEDIGREGYVKLAEILQYPVNDDVSEEDIKKVLVEDDDYLTLKEEVDAD